MTKIAFYVEIDNTILYATANFTEGEEETNYPDQCEFEHAYIKDVCVTEMLSPTQISDIEEKLAQIHLEREKEPTIYKHYILADIIKTKNVIVKIEEIAMFTPNYEELKLRNLNAKLFNLIEQL
jgi:hypothetical protein